MIFESFMILFGWFSAAAFVAVSGYKIAKIAALPMNLRWEVYPVPHEAEDKRGYGGSYMEQVDWAKMPRTGSKLPGYLEMAIEIATMRKIKAHNPYGIWLFSLAMHWGIYLYFGWLLLLVIGNLVFVAAWPYLTNIVGGAACVLGAFGCLALVIKRTTNPALHLYTTPLDYFNLLFLASFFALGLASWAPGFSFAAHAAYIGSVLFFKPIAVPLMVSLEFLLFELFMIYMPFSKLLHYFAKYFTFDLTLWDDEFKTKGSAVDRKIVAQLAYRVNWSAPHVVRGKTWLEQAEARAVEGEKK